MAMSAMAVEERWVVGRSWN